MDNKNQREKVTCAECGVEQTGDGDGWKYSNMQLADRSVATRFYCSREHMRAFAAKATGEEGNRLRAMLAG